MFHPYRHRTALVLAVALGVATAGCASPLYQSRGVYSQTIERRAYDNGHGEGLSRGRDDARSGREFSYTRSGEYRAADIGYRRQDGSKDEYRRTFREGFQAGYTEGFNQYARTFPRTTPYPRGTRQGIYTSPAGESGYRDGLEAGRNDARRRGPFDPQRSSRYRSADHNYNRRYGSKDDYRREYRVAFERGYQAGFTGARS